VAVALVDVFVKVVVVCELVPVVDVEVFVAVVVVFELVDV